VQVELVRMTENSEGTMSGITDGWLKKVTTAIKFSLAEMADTFRNKIKQTHAMLET